MNRKRNPPSSITIDLDRDELVLLADLAHYYERSMGRMRHFIKLTAGSETKLRLRFIREESDVLEKFLAGELSGGDRGTTRTPVRMTLRTFIALWGRLLSVTLISRSRRKLKGQRAQELDALRDRFSAVMRDLYTNLPDVVQSEIGTRRAREVPWMMERLEAPVTESAE